MAIGIRELLILLAIVLLVFGSRRLRTIAADLGNAVRDFRRGIRPADLSEPSDTPPNSAELHRERITHSRDLKSE